MILTYRQGDLYSAAIAGGLICYQLPRAAAAAAICEKVDGVSLTQANAMLDKAATPDAWRATWSSAVSSDLANLSHEVASLTDRERADRLAAKIETATAMLADVQSQLAEANQHERDRVVAAAADAKRRAALVEQQRKAADEEQRQAEAAALKKLDRRAARVGDIVEVTEAAKVVIDRETRTVRRVVARYKANEVPPEVAAMLK